MGKRVLGQESLYMIRVALSLSWVMTARLGSLIDAGRERRHQENSVFQLPFVADILGMVWYYQENILDSGVLRQGNYQIALLTSGVINRFRWDMRQI
jgi:hypothetical protein